MTRAAAAVLLADLTENDSSEYGQALRVAVLALVPKPRAAKPKPSRHVAAFLKIRFPTPNVWTGPPGWQNVERAMSPEAKAQFSYGRTARVKPPALLAAARVREEVNA